MIRQTNENGFALAETLVSAAIIAAMLGVTFQSITISAQQSRMIEQRRLALLVAQSQIAVSDAVTSTSFGEARGVTVGINWRVSVTPYQGATPSSVPIELVTVSAGNGTGGASLITLKTLRIAR